jgi:hypothetical protein
MEHDPEASSPNPALASFPWSFAHSVVSNLTGEIVIGRRTILSIGCYSPPTSDDDCPREPLYSNPDVPFQRIAQPSGTTAPDNNGRSRFNAKTGALIAPYVAAFRGPDAVSQRIFRNGLEKLSDALP